MTLVEMKYNRGKRLKQERRQKNKFQTDVCTMKCTQFSNRLDRSGIGTDDIKDNIKLLKTQSRL